MSGLKQFHLLNSKLPKTNLNANLVNFIYLKDQNVVQLGFSPICINKINFMIFGINKIHLLSIFQKPSFKPHLNLNNLIGLNFEILKLW